MEIVFYYPCVDSLLIVIKKAFNSVQTLFLLEQNKILLDQNIYTFWVLFRHSILQIFYETDFC